MPPSPPPIILPHRLSFSLLNRVVIALILVALTFTVSASPTAYARPLLAATPSATISAPTTLFIGQEFDFTVTFNNTGSDTGYGPYLDLLFPVNGADGAAGSSTADGIDFNTATYLGLTLTASELTFPDDDGGGPGTSGCVDHPYAQDTSGAPLQVCGTAGDGFCARQSHGSRAGAGTTTLPAIG